VTGTLPPVLVERAHAWRRAMAAAELKLRDVADRTGLDTGRLLCVLDAQVVPGALEVDALEAILGRVEPGGAASETASALQPSPARGRPPGLVSDAGLAARRSRAAAWKLRAGNIAEFAIRVGIGYSRASALLKGRLEPSADEIVRIEALLAAPAAPSEPRAKELYAGLSEVARGRAAGLRARLAQARMTAAELGRRCGIDAGRVKGLTSNGSTPTGDELKKIRRVLGD
jgi:transcriptional regulator with XRE-family HTH domain